MIAALFLLQSSVMPLDVTGVWYTENKDSQVEIVQEDDTVTGRIIWYVNYQEEIVRDKENPEEDLRDRDLLGMPILEDFSQGNDKWRKGKIYDPTEGKTYRSAIYRLDEDTLAVQGCVSVICVTQEWERVPEDAVVRGQRGAD